jgi:2-oxoglutarate ferredoxin oxidoreductase subunit beta
MPASLPLLTTSDLATDQEVGWCPGCGDYSILAQLKQVLASLGVPREKIVLVTGIGCAGRTAHYVNTFGFQTIHGQAPAIATGVKLANPELQVWVVTGDGDALGAGGNHLLHALRRNVDLKIVMFNNEVFGLAKGPHSPTARVGTRTRTSPVGSFETPLKPLALALAAEATFVARTLDVDIDHLSETLTRAARHKGAAFVEIYQNCKVFNDGVFEYATDKDIKADSLLYLEQGRPLVFGKDRNRALQLMGIDPMVVSTNGSTPMDDILVHDEQAAEPTQAFLLSRLTGPDFPEVVGVLRAIDRPTFEEQLLEQLGPTRAALPAVLAGDDPWTVE